MGDRMRVAGFGLASIWLIAAASRPAAAQAGAADPAPCREILASMALVPPAVKAQAAITRPDEQTCRFAPVAVQFGPFVGWTMDSLTVQGLIPAAGGAASQQTVRIEAHGLRNVPPRANPVTAYIIKVGSIPFDVDIDYVNDPADQTFTLNQYIMHGDGIGSFEVKAALSGIKVPANPLAAPPGGAPPLPDITTLGLKSFSLRLDNHGFIERMITPAVVGFLASSEPTADPEPAIATRKLAIAAMLRATLPSYGVSTETADALSRFVSDFPHPTGSLQCSLAADPPLRVPTDGDAPNPAMIMPMVAASHPACTYVRS